MSWVGKGTMDLGGEGEETMEAWIVVLGENVVFVTCHMSLDFLEKLIFQILLVSFSVTCDTMRGNTVQIRCGRGREYK